MNQQRVKKAVLTPGEVVRELRQKKGWTQAILAEITDMAVSNLSNIESGRSRLGEDRAILLGAALGVRPEFLLFPNGFEREDLKPRLKEIQKRIRKLHGDLAA
jgi:transcriptional regulator with XRE-family HTH domain